MHAMADMRSPSHPDDLVSIGDAAKALGMTYQRLRHHVDRQGFARWEKGGVLQVSMSEVRAYIDRLYEVRPIERRGREDGDTAQEE